jgi:hypothetical protein
MPAILAAHRAHAAEPPERPMLRRLVAGAALLASAIVSPPTQPPRRADPVDRPAVRRAAVRPGAIVYPPE